MKKYTYVHEHRHGVETGTFQTDTEGFLVALTGDGEYQVARLALAELLSIDYEPDQIESLDIHELSAFRRWRYKVDASFSKEAWAEALHDSEEANGA
tara:strand:- start:571 stop:861 length:291 start_codon:yes stop_codon:yes gene_type:complete